MSTADSRKVLVSAVNPASTQDWPRMIAMTAATQNRAIRQITVILTHRGLIGAGEG
ncbi:hypothetical protein [Brevundimonas sp. TWP2-3-4b2]|uniref:hypothetical protein n=1 Tax=Brevundimonas sp. TWP2-3-4b2 TaxID=2804595 RepID=UPI003CEBA7D2